MKPITTNLATLLAQREEKLRQKAELEAKLLENKAQREKIVAESSGVNDTSALSKLELLVAHQEMTTNKLALLGRELEGYKIQIAGESAWARKKALELLVERRDRVMARLRNKIAEFYPDNGGQEALERALTALERAGALPPEVLRLRKRISGIEGQHALGMCPVEFGRQILGLVNTAFAQCFPVSEEA